MSSLPRSRPQPTSTSVVRYSEANVPTEYGDLKVIVYREQLGRGKCARADGPEAFAGTLVAGRRRRDGHRTKLRPDVERGGSPARRRGRQSAPSAL